MTIDDFTAALTKFSDETVPKAIVAAKADLTRRVMSDLIDGTPDSLSGTPIDTGQARANWWPTNGAPSGEVFELGFQAASLSAALRTGSGRVGGFEPLPKQERISAAEAKALSMARLAEVIAGMQPYGIVYVTNNLDYIVNLNGGSSTQAPSAFVETAVITAGAAFNAGERINPAP